eukprot:297017_1
MATNYLDKKYKEFLQRYSHNPTADQLRRFAKISFVDAKTYISSRQPNIKGISSNLSPQKSSQWICDTCTFLNHKLMSICELCGSPKSKENKYQKKSSKNTTNSISDGQNSQNITNNSSNVISNTEHKQNSAHILYQQQSKPFNVLPLKTKAHMQSKSTIHSSQLKNNNESKAKVIDKDSVSSTSTSSYHRITNKTDSNNIQLKKILDSK